MSPRIFTALPSVAACLVLGSASSTGQASITGAPWPANKDASRALTSLDLASLKDVGPPFPEPRRHFVALSPDRKMIAFQVRQGDPRSNTYRLQLLALEIRPGALPVILDDGGDLILQRAAGMSGVIGETGLPDTIAPQWSSDGKFVFFLKRSRGTTKIWRAAVDGRDSAPLVGVVGDVDSFVISADRQRIIYSRWQTDERDREARNREALDGFRYDKRFKPLSADGPDALPSQHRVVSTIDLTTGAVEAASGSDTQRLDEQSSDPSTPLPAVAADRRRAWVARNGDIGVGPPPRLMAEDAQHHPLRCTARACEAPTALWWSADESRVNFFHREGWGDEKTALYEWRPGAEAPARLFATSDLLLDCQPVETQIVCAAESSAAPRKIVLLEPTTGKSAILYDPNPNFSGFSLGRVERLHWRSSFGSEVFGDLVLPVGYDERKKYPLIVVQYISRGFLRGGVGDEFPIQVFANRGYAVLSIQRPKLSAIALASRSAAELERRLLTRLRDRRNVLSSIELAVRTLIRRGIADPERVGITGLSDGSSTVQFAAINSRLFKAGSATGCCWDPFQDAYLGPITARAFHSFGWPKLIDYDAPPWNRMSLVSNARNVRFPILIQQSDDEFRGAIASVTAVQQAGKSAALFVFPGEHHIKWQPAHRLAVYERNIRWFDYWLKGIGRGDEWQHD